LQPVLSLELGFFCLQTRDEIGMRDEVFLRDKGGKRGPRNRLLTVRQTKSLTDVA
jgi:hypothetical protein